MMQAYFFRAYDEAITQCGLMRLPEDFEKMMRVALGGGYDAFRAALEEEPPVSVRLGDKHPIEAESCGGVDWCASGLYLPGRPVFALDPLWHCGAYYVQEASSMYLERVLGEHVQGPVNFLDLCAAPGGKATHAMSVLPDGSFVAANEFVPLRAAVLCENVLKHGSPDALVCNAAPEEFASFEGMFDVMLCDLPCSGEGMFRKEPEALAQWSLAKVEACAALQRKIVSAAWPALREGGLLIYSTCTFNPDENEGNIEWVSRELGAEILSAEHFYFHLTRGEGLFMAALRKTSAGGDYDRVSAFSPGPGRSVRAPKLKPYSGPEILGGEDYRLLELNGMECAVGERAAATAAVLASRLKVLAAGIPLRSPGGKRQPAPGLAWSKRLNEEAFPSVNLDRDEALRYLKGESFNAGGCPKGEVLVKYGSFALGWANNVGSRANNLYPKPYRIKINIRPCKSYFWEPGHRPECPT